ncbi:MAG: formylglycine-generating enzyme family protein [Kiritimatiellae bacterium]|nr:formylglycine-generating enzyme family protein [Kiritimatiellia bacterium]
MKKILEIVILTGFFMAQLTFHAFAVDAQVTDVSVRQRWPWDRLVDIDYVLSCDPTQRVDIALTAYNGSERLSIPQEAWSGDFENVGQGIKRIVLDISKTAYTNEALTRFYVDLTPTERALYMIVDLTKAAGDADQIEYVYESDLVTNKWGTWQRDFVTNGSEVVESLIWTGVTNDIAYKTDKLVLRRVQEGDFLMGTGFPVTLTKGYYAGVFEITETQWARVMTGAGGTGVQAKNQLSYNMLRGATNDVPSVNWHATGTVVSPTAFLGILRSKTGIATFDLPTEAQWEYACRAGTTSFFNDGQSTSKDDTAILDTLAWWTGNSYNAIHPVGEKLPNAWGLYDIHGNVWEWCLDWHLHPLTGGTDPAGAETGTVRIIRGGGKQQAPESCASGARANLDPSLVNSGGGVRVVRNMP